MFKSSARIATTGLVAGLLGSVAAAVVVVYLVSAGVIHQSGMVGAYANREVVALLGERGMSAHVVGGERPAVLAVPVGRDVEKPMPLLLLLHGYGDDALALVKFYDFASRAEDGGFGILMADGVRDQDGQRYWNATDLCCGNTDVKPDDVAYLVGLVEEAGTLAAFDRMYVLGHSNGGFMAYWLACEGLAGLSGVVVISGSSFEDGGRCDRADAVSVLHIHGDRDRVVKIDGGRLPAWGAGRYPGAAEVVERWARRAGCDPSVERDVAFKIGDLITKPWVHVSRQRDGCVEGVTVEFWEVSGAGHIISGSRFTDRVLEWLFEQGPERGQRFVS